MGKLKYLLLAILLIGIGRCIFQYTKEFTFDKISSTIATDMRRDLFAHIQSLSADFFDKTSTGELMARVKANMRRTYAGEDREKAEAPSGGGLRVSKDNGMVYKNGHPLELSAREFDILCFLSAAPGRVFSREELMEQVWGYDYYGDLRAVDVAIRRLREKIEDEPASPRYIITKRGMGYYFADGE